MSVLETAALVDIEKGYEGKRARAGLSLDGPMQCQPPITADINRPFMMMTADFTRAGKLSAADFWTHLHGWRRDLRIDGGTEIPYSDAVWLLPQMARLTGMSDQKLTGFIGTFDPSLAVKSSRRTRSPSSTCDYATSWG
ncbi:hypothetical protein [Actinoplanes sandaracinus]|uniref:hypothetical protein n=1 Tax=Actinoplanes sandaracinus TaxID=3045177 RepID=UPI00389952B7